MGAPWQAASMHPAARPSSGPEVRGRVPARTAGQRRSERPTRGRAPEALGGGEPRSGGTPPLPDDQNWFQRYWFVTSWWNWISAGFTSAPSARGQRSAWACLSSAYRSWTASPRSSFASFDDLNGRIAS